MSSSDTTAIAAGRSPERFDPADDAGTLVHSEHALRYMWAAQAVSGADVLDAGCGTGYGTAILSGGGPARLAAVDIAGECVERVRAQLDGVDAQVADVRELPFADDAFDIVVCFEVIEHMERRAEAVREFGRVLRPSGTLLISSPNRNTYPPGNEFHVHEYTPDELEDELSAVFSTVRCYRQDAWLGSTLRPKGGASDSGTANLVTQEREPREELFTVAAASNGTPPELDAIAVLGEPFEAKWWKDQVDDARAQARASVDEWRREHAKAADKLAQTEARLAELGRRMVDVEQDNAILREEVDAERNRLAEAHYRIERSDTVVRDMQASPSWRLTAPLRWLKRVVSR